jgi:aspartyl/asparaginyl beta-hydroxylase (cupin superfamily)
MQLTNAVEELFDCDISEIRSQLRRMSPEIWDVDAFRQRVSRAHQQTRSIRIAWLPNNWLHQNPLNVDYPGYAPEGLAAAATQVADKLAAHFQGQIAKIVLAELSPGGHIAPHVDHGDALTLVHRCHVPIVTNEKVRMLIDGGTYMFREGRAYEFDNTRLHGVANDGAEPRVHMICDVLNMADAGRQVLARAQAGAAAPQ